MKNCFAGGNFETADCKGLQLPCCLICERIEFTFQWRNGGGSYERVEFDSINCGNFILIDADLPAYFISDYCSRKRVKRNLIRITGDGVFQIVY